MVTKKKLLKNKTPVGWREWLGLPELGLPAIKAKIDTGAKTSSLHAFNISIVEKDERKYASFDIHPLHGNKTITVTCLAPLVDRRYVTDSGGHRELRYVIKTPLMVGENLINIEITLADRETMAFRMLLGRQAMQLAGMVVLPARSMLLGKNTEEEILEIYEEYYDIEN